MVSKSIFILINIFGTFSGFSKKGFVFFGTSSGFGTILLPKPEEVPKKHFLPKPEEVPKKKERFSYLRAWGPPRHESLWLFFLFFLVPLQVLAKKFCFFWYRFRFWHDFIAKA